MGTEFAEKILDGMVDADGFCGERGLSERQFDCIAQHLEAREPEHWVGWTGTRGGREIFQQTDYVGNVGKYHVWLNELWHFNRRCTVVEIKPRPQEEVERELEFRKLAKFEHSEWRHEPKERLDMELTLVREYAYEVPVYGYRDRYDTKHIYTFADAEGNCYVWKTGNLVKVETWDGDGNLVDEVYAEPGDKVFMKATVKEHNEYRGTKQTVITRPKINGIERAA